ncbi:MAG TPA: alpha/beta fold hydrolase [Chloroflexota bacterium]
MESTPSTVTSKDGTTIAFERLGSGPAILLVSPALGDHSGNAKLANVLTRNLTVINYDRRGRGASADTHPYAVAREVEDIQALIEAAGSPAYLFGNSSGAVLALEAAATLGSQVKALLMYEPPFVVDDSRPPLPEEYLAYLHDLISQGRRGDAVQYFMSRAVGVPEEMLDGMRRDPMWASLEAAADTLPYDGEVMGDTMSGKALPAHRWDSVEAPALVMAGGASPAWIQHAAQALAGTLPRCKYRVLEGCDHSAVTTAPVDLATTMYGFFLAEHL